MANEVAKTAPKAPAVNWEQPTNSRGLESLVPFISTQVERGLPSFMAGSAQRLIRCMLTACNANPALFECTPISLFAGTIQAAQLGLEIGGPRGEAYLVPYWNNKKRIKEAQLQVGYKGFVQLGYRSSMLKRCTPVQVRKGDVYEVVRGTDQKLLHIPKRNNKDVVTDFYVVIELTNGGIDFEEMTLEEAIAWRERYASSKGGPWYEGPDPAQGQPSNEFMEMAGKTLIRKMFKRMPLSAESQIAAGLDEQADHGITQNLAGVALPEFVPPGPTATQRLEEAVEKAEGGSEAPKEAPAKSPPPPAAPAKTKAAKPAPKPEPAPEAAEGPPPGDDQDVPDRPAEPTSAPPRAKSALETAVDKFEAAGGNTGKWVEAMGFDSIATMEVECSEKRKERLINNLQIMLNSRDADFFDK